MAARPEEFYGNELSEPVVTIDDGSVPEECVALVDSAGLALLVVLGSLRLRRWLACVLDDAFAVSGHDVGQILASPPAHRCSPTRSRVIKPPTSERELACGQ
ncbi:hypothetical protein [Nonomuraea sp. NPDC049158]|uniref:hypothetical protein n=1 Tax=Nonomuraea sp. NPDC049158 TaxID=3155649 RepID=UPI0033F60F05